MKSFRICKSTVSMILALIMLVSMFSVAFVNTAAAETDIAETGATIPDGTVLYLNPNTWDTDNPVYFCHVFKAGTNTVADYKATLDSTSGYYKITVSGSSFDSYLWVRMPTGSASLNWDTKWNQTNDISYNGSHNLCKITGWDPSNFECSTYTPSGGSTDPTDPPTEPDDPDDPAEKIEISFLLNSDTKWVSSDDAKMFINDGSKNYEMTETVDTKSGHVMWTAEVPAKSSYTFYRTSYFFDKSNASENEWNKWTASGRATTNTVFKATSNTAGSWAAASTVNAADPKDIENFWDDLWIAPADKNDVDHAVKVYYDGSKFNLFVPSYYDLSNVVVYSDHESVVIGNTTIASGSTASLTTGLNKTFEFKDGSTTTSKPKLNIYQTESTAAMMMTTKEELYTGTTAGLQSSNAWPSGAGITSTNYNNVYKDAIETKGSYHFYKENGELLNADDQVLKKIKGRGNSSFEASMRIYGKYAYNFNLDTKQELIKGSTPSKKWCMLANNVDHTMMRNTFIYQLSNDLGLNFGPETRLVDVYDNGKYLGAFTITEKVEYGKNTLMAEDANGKKIKNLDDGNAEANSVYPLDAEGKPNTDADPLYEFDTDDLDAGTEDSITINGQKYDYKYYATYDRPEVTDDDGNVLVEAADNLSFVSPEDFDTKYNYLLEHELSSRFKAEASWFLTPKGQPVVVKYPEFANQEQMEWIIREYAAMEQAVYNNDYNTFSSLIDVDSFAKMYLIQELTINLDTCATSYYIHNEFRDGKSILVAGPVWDFDWSMGAYAGNTKWIYNGSSVVSSPNASNPEQMFAKKKAIKTDSSPSNGVSWENNYNLQAKMANNSAFWTECQRIWTNDMAPLLYSYLIDDYSKTTDTGKIVTEWLPKFKSSMDMNNARWGVYNFTNAENGGDSWGTKVTSDYVKGTGLTATSNFKIGNTGTSGNAAKCYENTVYYLNDWLSTRKDYMSGTGNLYNADLLEKYEFSEVTFTGDQDVDDDTKLRVTPSATVTMNGEAVANEDIEYTIYVNGEAVGTYAYPTPQTITLTEETNNVYIKVSVKDTDESAQSDPQTFNVYFASYTVENVTFEGAQSDDGSKVTITPSATVKLDGVELTTDQYQYTIYLNDVAVAGPIAFTTPSTTINLEHGIVNEVYVKVTPVDDTSKSGTSATMKFSYGVEVDKVSVTFNFKSSASYRYLPKIKANGGEILDMNKGVLIGKNASQTQTYNWFTATVELEVDKTTSVVFSNAYSMSATVQIKATEETTYYFGVDNLNDGSLAVDLTEFNTSDENDQKMLNFKQSASHMVYSSSLDPEIATTSINGRILKMGDTDEDNKLTVLDATNAQMALAKKTTLTPTGAAVSDYNLDGVSSIMDVTEVQTFLAQ